MPAFDLPGTEEGLHVRFFDREFNQAIDELANESTKTDIEVLTWQAIKLVLALVFRTRLATFTSESAEKLELFAGILSKGTGFPRQGRARAGWWPAWRGLGMFGLPTGTNSTVLGSAEGEFIDGRHRASRPFIVVANDVPYIDKLDAEDRIIEGGTAGRFQDMQDEITRRYALNMRRHSG